MLDTVLRIVFRCLLALRYRISVVGLDELGKKDEHGILFLPNHPALIDPLILLCYLTRRFDVRALAGRAQLEQPAIAWLASRVRVRKIPDAHERSGRARHRVASMLKETARALNAGEALVLYPAGRIYRHRFEELANNGGAAFLVRSCPSIRIVLVRTTGLWGSAFGYGCGGAPSVGSALKRGIIGLTKSGLFFAPRRDITIEFTEVSDFPRNANREQVNRFLESHYNEKSPSACYVPYSIWERGSARLLPEPEYRAAPQATLSETEIAPSPES